METRQRARSDAQKQQRRQAILDAAWELYRTTPYDAITIAGVAERVNLAKGTIYLYFKTKEELFLALQEQQLNAWFDTLDQQLRETETQLDTQAIARLLSESVVAQPDFTRLLAILHPVIEQNIEHEAARAFKRFLHQRLAETGSFIEQRLAFLQPGMGAQLLLWAYALVIGFKHLSDPSPVMREVMQDPELAGMVVEFGPAFGAALQAMISGLEQITHT